MTNNMKRAYAKMIAAALAIIEQHPLPVQKVIKEMARIMTTPNDEDDINMATETLIEALFPSKPVDL